MLNNCNKCKDLVLLTGKNNSGGLLATNELTATARVKWDCWSKKENPSTNEMVWDFHSVETPVGDVINEMKSWWMDFNVHHDQAKYFDRAKRYKRWNIPRGHAHVIQDFSQNGDYDVKKEHHSRYYEAHQYVCPLPSIFCLPTSHFASPPPIPGA